MPKHIDQLFAKINNCYLADEHQLIQQYLTILQEYSPETIKKNSYNWVAQTRNLKDQQALSDAFLSEYQLNSEEGIILMSLAEALLRIPDAATQDIFVQEKLTSADWKKHVMHSDSLLVNLSSSALFISGMFGRFAIKDSALWQQGYEGVLSRLGVPLVRKAIKQAMRLLGNHYVFSENIDAAMLLAEQQHAVSYSFDMLGEAAISELHAQQYYSAYHKAIRAAASQINEQSSLYEGNGVSIKLSALCTRYEAIQHKHAVKQVSEKLLNLTRLARDVGIHITIDAEESERLQMSLEIFQLVFQHKDLADWVGLGLAVQAYQKRALPVIHCLAALSRQHGKKIPIRLVKGAYWDSEIKAAQQAGLTDYPVFTHKAATDLSYLACVKTLFSYADCFYPQFATHNAHTIAAIRALNTDACNYEMQRLHGMGELLYRTIAETEDENIPVRVYAPVGLYHDLLPYLVRRLLENGANTSFICQLENAELAIEQVIADPVLHIRQNFTNYRVAITLPGDIYLPERKNANGLNLHDLQQLHRIDQDLAVLQHLTWKDEAATNGQQIAIRNPANLNDIVGTMAQANAEDIALTVEKATHAFDSWRLEPVNKRAECLLKTAELIQQHQLELLSLCIREGGRTISDACDEIREAIDFCRYYAASAVNLMAKGEALPSITGEENSLYYYGRGVFVCISPWNFPIAIFVGQISAALVAGNTVIAKPAENTPFTAMRCIQLFYEAGIPSDVLRFVPANGDFAGQHLLNDQRISGVAFTGSTQTASKINHYLAAHQQIKPLIAETGGQNVMIADSSALPEQLVRDIIHSAFNSAGQRCSALRVLIVQQDISKRVISLIIGAMRELIIGDPQYYDTDIGPVINAGAVNRLNDHLHYLNTQNCKLIYQNTLDKNLAPGYFFAPALIEIEDLNCLRDEVFGPILHIMRFKAETLPNIIEQINASGYGLTLGVHSRIQAHINYIGKHARVGNIYVNRNMIGATVGSQPFGGMCLSGTGPKAGGPNYLQRFTVEQTVSVNSAAIGGNTQLMAKDLQ